MKRTFQVCLLAALWLLPMAALPQTAPLTRDQERERLRTTLNRVGALSDVNVSFRQSDKQPWNFVGQVTSGLKNAESLEVVLSVTEDHTIHLRVYPHFKGGYINVGKATDSPGLARKLLNMNYHTFFYWGADDDGDIYGGYKFTLESGYPEESIQIVLRSIRNTDQFIGSLRPFVDGSAAAQ